MQRFAYLDHAQAMPLERRNPTQNRAEVPRRRVLEIVAAAGLAL